ncbi:PREDICTED: fatty acid synthase-like, partial [Dinoponera quadriceps]|uniref:Fatty acid synthase-like n=1 Tax=Dinoponera quadriceps TaxID=609295 RepID=A0A6P3YAA9_DINQU
MTSFEAHATDLMCKILLENTYEAIIYAGINPKELRGTKTGIFIGSCHTEKRNIIIYYRLQAAGYPIVGCSQYLLANSISNWFGLNRLSCALDTACSSSHYAMAEAYRMIRSGECDAAIVGAPTAGYCKPPFDASGTGYMRSEAVAILYLQKAKDARRIYATYVCAKTNSDGF